MRGLLLLLLQAIPIVATSSGKWAIKVASSSSSFSLGGRGSRALRLERGLRSLGLGLESHPVGEDYYLLSDLDGLAPSSSREEMEEILSQFKEVEWFELQVPQIREKRSYFSDPLYPQQWHLENSKEGNDISVVPVWMQGINGTGVTVAMVDDGLDYTHDDIAPNYAQSSSYDLNRGISDPMPTVASDNHGTRCAGEIAAAANNNVCGVGIAFNAKISGITLISLNPTDSDEASALNYKNQNNHIYSNSWGPTDDAKTLEGPGTLTKQAFKRGVTEGRKGLGSIFIFASGNGAEKGDDCNFDGYANSIYTMAIGAITDSNTLPSYSEGCAALTAVTYSSGGRAGIATVDLNQQCTTRHSGTSAAAPIAAGMAALALSARPDLTWRDMQHLFIRSTDIILGEDSGWKTNGANLSIHHRLGFGSLNATKLIENALIWSSVEPSSSYSSGSMHLNREIEKGSSSTKFTYQTPFNSTQLPKVLEHVQVTLTITFEYRGMLEIVLVSPMGTPSLLAPQRSSDTSSNGYKEWTFVTVRCWGEDPQGTWVLRIRDYSGLEVWPGRLEKWEIVFHGTGALEQQGRVTTKLNTPLLVAIGSVSAMVGLFLVYLVYRAIRRSREHKEAGEREEAEQGQSSEQLLEQDWFAEEEEEEGGQKGQKKKKEKKKEKEKKKNGKKGSNLKNSLQFTSSTHLRVEDDGNESLDDELPEDEPFGILRDRLNVEDDEDALELDERHPLTPNS